MACYTNNITVSYAGCTGHRVTCGTNRPITWSDAVQGGPVYASQVNELRSNIRDEISAWNIHRFYEVPITEPNPIVPGGAISASTFDNLSNMITGVYGGPPFVVGTTNLIDDAAWDTLIARYNAVRQNCVCNSDCTCNTVCDCNVYCCDYSDERLKTEIVYC